MLKKTLSIIGTVAVAVALVIMSYTIGVRKGHKDLTGSDKAVCDTVYQTKIVSVSSPPLLSSRLGVLMRVPVIDTIRVRDTLYVEVPKEIKTYGDSTFKAVVSGYQPSLDLLELYIPTKTVTVRTPAPKWSFGITAGVGVYYGLSTRRMDVGTGLTVGVNYRF